MAYELVFKLFSWLISGKRHELVEIPSLAGSSTRRIEPQERILESLTRSGRTIPKAGTGGERDQSCMCRQKKKKRRIVSMQEIR